MKPIYYYDGKFYSIDTPAIPLSDRSIFFADAVYDACLVKDGRPFLLEEHLDRFYRSCGAIRIEPKLTKKELKILLFEICSRAECKFAFLYFQASRSADVRRHFFTDTDKNHLLVSVSEVKMPDRNYALHLILAQDRRYEFCNIKTINLLPAVLASTRAVNMGADEAVFVRNGFVTECAHSNISILKDGTLITHPKSRYILPGIGRAHLINACMRLSIPVIERPFSVQELYDADEIFVTSSSKLCLRAESIEGKSVGMRDTKIADLLLDAIFFEFNSWQC